MSCRTYAGLASDRRDGMLSPEELQGLALHLVLCRECAELDEDLPGLGDLLRSAAEPAMPDAVEEAIRAEVERSRRGAGLGARLLRWAAHLVPRPGLVPSTGAALALLGFVVLIGVPRPRADLIPAGASSLPAGVEVEAAPIREASVLTVWDTGADRIVAAVDPTGFAAPLADAATRSAEEGTRLAAPLPGVHIFLFERIVVRG